MDASGTTARSRPRWRWLGLALLVAAALLIFLFGHFLLLVFAALLAATAIAGASERLAHALGARYGVGLLLTILVVVLLAFAIGWWIVPPLSDQIGQLVAKIPQAEQRLRDMVDRLPWLQTLLGQAKGGAQSGMSLGEIAGYASSAAGSLMSVVGELLVILVAAVYLAAQPQLYIRGTLRLVPPAYRHRAGRTIGCAGEYLRRWLVGQIIAMASVGALTALTFWLIGMPLTLALALIAGLLTFIPYLGVFLSLLPAEMIALTQSPMMPLYVAGAFLLNHVVEGYVIEPLVQRRMNSFPPALLLLTQTAMWLLAGLLGVLLATPLAVTAIAVIRIWYIETMIEPEERAAGTPEKS